MHLVSCTSQVPYYLKWHLIKKQSPAMSVLFVVLLEVETM